MENMEIERKFLIRKLPEHLEDYTHHEIEQGYLCTSPVVRIRRNDDRYTLTYKSRGLMAREEYNLPLTKEGYEHLREKTDGILITKTRYLIPIENGLQVELDAFHGDYQGLLLAEVEFPDIETANAFKMLDWFETDVTEDTRFHNSTLSRGCVSVLNK